MTVSTRTRVGFTASVIGRGVDGDGPVGVVVEGNPRRMTEGRCHADDECWVRGKVNRKDGVG